jgi:membrane-associated protein
MITAAIVSVLNMNHLLPMLISQYGSLVYLGLFFVIFIETGLVFFPFLPGDSLLFLSGSIAALTDHSLNVVVLLILLGIAAVVGDSVNFEIGKRFGNYLTTNEKWKKRIKPQHLQQAHDFFDRHGSGAIFLGRFVPIVRTLVPFVAGSSEMKYRNFIAYNLLGGFTWVLVAVLSGYFFGNIPFIQSHFELIMVAIVVISLIPVAIVSLRQRGKTNIGSEQ